jgi:endonuclease G, mitochondrial
VCGDNIDLLLLELDERVSDVQPAKIATNEIPNDFPTVQPSPDFGSLEVVGFGTTDAKGSPDTFGQKRFAFVGIAGDDPDRLGYRRGLEFAAGKTGSGTDTCAGDSGGPGFLHLVANNQTLLLGCTARSTQTSPNPPPGVNCGDGGVYVRIDKQIQWIRGVAADVRSTLP